VARATTAGLIGAMKERPAPEVGTGRYGRGPAGSRSRHRSRLALWRLDTGRPKRPRWSEECWPGIPPSLILVKTRVRRGEGGGIAFHELHVASSPSMSHSDLAAGRFRDELPHGAWHDGLQDSVPQKEGRKVEPSNVRPLRPGDDEIETPVSTRPSLVCDAGPIRHGIRGSVI